MLFALDGNCGDACILCREKLAYVLKLLFNPCFVIVAFTLSAHYTFASPVFTETNDKTCDLMILKSSVFLFIVFQNIFFLITVTLPAGIIFCFAFCLIKYKKGIEKR